MNESRSCDYGSGEMTEPKNIRKRMLYQCFFKKQFRFYLCIMEIIIRD